LIDQIYPNINAVRRKHLTANHDRICWHKSMKIHMKSGGIRWHNDCVDCACINKKGHCYDIRRIWRTHFQPNNWPFLTVKSPCYHFPLCGGQAILLNKPDSHFCYRNTVSAQMFSHGWKS